MEQKVLYSLMGNDFAGDHFPTISFRLGLFFVCPVLDVTGHNTRQISTLNIPSKEKFGSSGATWGPRRKEIQKKVPDEEKSHSSIVKRNLKSALTGTPARADWFLEDSYHQSLPTAGFEMFWSSKYLVAIIITTTRHIRWKLCNVMIRFSSLSLLRFNKATKTRKGRNLNQIEYVADTSIRLEEGDRCRSMVIPSQSMMYSCGAEEHQQEEALRQKCPICSTVQKSLFLHWIEPTFRGLEVFPDRQLSERRQRHCSCMTTIGHWNSLWLVITDWWMSDHLHSCHLSCGDSDARYERFFAWRCYRTLVCRIRRTLCPGTVIASCSWGKTLACVVL